MLIILLLAFLLVVRLFRIETVKDRRNAFALVVVSLLINLLALLFIQIEISGDEMLGTIGSDTLLYYRKALWLLDNEAEVFKVLKKFAGGYTVFCYLVLKTSFIKSAYIIPVANIFIFLNILLQIYYFLSESKASRQVTFISLLLILLNGHIIWTTINILKDILLIFLVFEVIYLLVNQNIRPYTRWLLIGLILTYIHFIRPYIEILMVPVILYLFYLKNVELYTGILKRNKKRIRLIFAFAALAILLFYVQYQEVIHLKYKWFMIMAEENGRKAMEAYGSEADFLFELPMYQRFFIGFARFVLLPFPIKILLAENHLTFGILAFIGSSIWWVLGTYFLVSVFKYRSKLNNSILLFKVILLFTLLLAITYVFLYAGTASSRLRVPMYIAGTVFGVNALANIRPANNLVLMIIAFTVFLVVNIVPLFL